uniref:Putative secreted protein n=1 Tax=Ixodes ricinus TaxID=34613 RepID=A0A6B0UIK3_IXORI
MANRGAAFVLSGSAVGALLGVSSPGGLPVPLLDMPTREGNGCKPTRMSYFPWLLCFPIEAPLRLRNSEITRLSHDEPVSAVSSADEEVPRDFSRCGLPNLHTPT